MIMRSFCTQDHADVNERDNTGAIPLYFAAQEGYVDVVRYLVKLGADPLSKA